MAKKGKGKKPKHVCVIPHDPGFMLRVFVDEQPVIVADSEMLDYHSRFSCGVPMPILAGEGFAYDSETVSPKIPSVYLTLERVM